VLASAVLIALFSTILYTIIKKNVYEEVSEQLIKQATYLSSSKEIKSAYLQKTMGISVKIVPKPPNIQDVTVIKTKENNRYYLTLFYPYDFQQRTYLELKKDVTSIEKFLKKLLKVIIITNIISFFLIILIAYLVASSMTVYIKSLTNKLSKLNEEMLKPIKVRDLPDEFQPLGKSINMLINRIQTFIKYQKELFIGIAHELKTPLAVMKLKNEVTLIKPREPKEYIETIKLNIKTINEMNKMIENVLKIGRQEADQFEPPVRMDLIEYLREKSRNYQLLAENEGKRLKMDLKPKSYTMMLQPTLLNHIIQNFIQNAIKFTQKGGTIELKSTPVKEGIKIEVMDEGPGIDEKKDLFAPFKREGEKGGVGLGLFLAKSAADAMGARIYIKNRKDKKGAVATLIIPSKLVCPLC